MKTTNSIYKLTIKGVLLSVMLFVPAFASAQQSELSMLMQKADQLGIDKSYITRLQERAQENGISEQQLADILTPAVALAENDLPFDMILEKTSEGFAKRVPEQALINVLRGLQEATQKAVPLIDPWMKRASVQEMISRNQASDSEQGFRNDLLKNTGRALNQGVSEESVLSFIEELGSDEIMSNINSRDIVASMRIYPDLPTTADNSALSQQLVVRSLKGGFKSSDLEKLPSAMRMAQARGQLPAGNIVNGILEQLQVGSPAGDILQNLFDGNIGGGPPSGLPGRPDNPAGRGGGNNG
ncbi:MAG: hypothetical protein WD357_04005 [Gracilimonas sp.]